MVLLYAFALEGSEFSTVYYYNNSMHAVLFMIGHAALQYNVMLMMQSVIVMIGPSTKLLDSDLLHATCKELRGIPSGMHYNMQVTRGPAVALKAESSKSSISTVCCYMTSGTFAN